MKVLKEQCATCIFRPGNPMELRPGRLSDMVRECRRTQAYIPCHETMVYTDEDGEEATGPVCRGFYDQMGEVSQLVRIAQRLGCLEFVAQDPAP